MQKAFKQMMRSVRINVNSKLDKSVAQVKQEMSKLFKAEYLAILEQYNYLRKMTVYAQQELNKFKTGVHLKETNHTYQAIADNFVK